MYTFAPSVEEMEGAGFAPEDYEEDPVAIWPDTAQAFDLFVFMQTQWRRDNGPCGLDYNVLFRKMDRMGLSVDEYDQLEADMQVMEATALETIRRNQAQQAT